MKLFTVTDLERVARLAASRIKDGRTDVEGVTREVVDIVATNTARVYDEFTVLEIAQRAAGIILEGEEIPPNVGGERVTAVAGEAARRAFKERTNGR